MKMGPRLELRQSQQLVMTPQLQQAIKLLQMTNLDLSAFVEAELERNPLLDRDAAPDPGAAEPAVPEGPAPDVSAADSFVAPDRVDRAMRDDSGPETVKDRVGEGAENIWDGDAPARVGPARDFASSGGGESYLADIIAETAVAPPSLMDQLAGQIALMRAPAAIRALALAFTAEIDESGYFRADPEEAAIRLGAGQADGRAALALLQGCEPTGIGARDLSECLALQLAEKDRLDPAMRIFVSHLDLLARADFRRLSRLCGVSEEDVRDMAAEIRRLDPRPARGFAPDPVFTAPPDILVARGQEGAWRVELNPETLPRVLVNSDYAAEIVASGDPAASVFVAECRQNASWLVRSLEQRAASMMTVGSEIVRRQAAFFEHGVSHLRPMTMRSVAEATGLHESTVSRVAAGKRLACARGVFELKFFFSQAIAAADGGDALSAESIRHRIRAMIDAEDARKTLSDDAIVKALRAEGVDIARRTVAKYREGMSIPSSVQRKRLKAAAQAG